MKRLVPYVEGQTEELFVNRILRNHLGQFGVTVERPILAITRPGPEECRGGFVNWPAVEADLRALFATNPEPEVRFTTLLDLYALPSQVPGYPGPSTGSRSAAAADAVEVAWRNHFGEPRFVPYFQRHEFEALVIADPPALERVFRSHAASLRREIAPTLAAPSAEDVDDGPTTHPSARLAKAVPDYLDRKPSFALFALLESDLGTVRSRCPRFHAWLTHWETSAWQHGP